MFGSRILPVGVCLVVGACASGWQVPQSATRIHAGMNAASAEASLRKALVGSDAAAGLCGRITAGMSYPTFVDMRQGEVTFSDFQAMVGGSRARVSGGTVSVTSDVTQDRRMFAFDFKAVERVMIMAPVEPGQCSKSVGNRQVTVKDSGGTYINVDMAPADFDAFLASVMFLSPRARFTQGAGL